jgi:DNA-binding transcriptional ArsR family regulator
MAKKTIRRRAVDDPASIRVLASPIRHELVDTLAALGGEATATQLAHEVERPADGLYYHLGLLVAAGLVIEVGDPERAERRFRLVGSGTKPLRLAYDLDARGSRPALAKYAGGLLQVALQDFSRALDQPGVATSGVRRELWTARNKGWVAPDELKEANALLERLCELLSQTRSRERNRCMTLSFVLAPSTSSQERAKSGR